MVVIHIDVLIAIAYTNICVAYRRYEYDFKKNEVTTCVYAELLKTAVQYYLKIDIYNL